MDPNFLEELQKLKEQKKADLNTMQDLAQLNVPDFEEIPLPELESEPQPKPEEKVSTGTIQFAKVSPDTPVQPPVPGGRRGKKPEPEKKETRAKNKNNKVLITVLISVIAGILVIGGLIGSFFAIRTSNQKDYSYAYWGMGVAIENGEFSYSFFGKLETITQYGAIGQVQAIAEFEDGNCIKETAFTAEGDVDLYYTHEYDGGFRVSSALYQEGQVVQSVKYTQEKDGKIKAVITYHLEENREEIAHLTLSEDGNLSVAEVYYEAGILRKTYEGTLVTDSVLLSVDGEIMSRTSYQYNDNKQILSGTEYDGKGNILSRLVNQYNDKNLLTKTIIYNGNGDIQNYQTFHYDQNNNPIKEIHYSADGTMEFQILKVYNEKNRVSKETGLSADGSTQYCYGYDYDSNGYVFKSIVYDTENITVIRQYTLMTRNEAGTVIETNTYTASNSLIERILYNEYGFITNLYQYNANGNLIQEETAQYDNKQRTTQREYTYYSDDGKKTKFLSQQYNEDSLVLVQIEDDLVQDFYIQRLFEYHADGWRQKETGFDKAGKTLFDRRYDEKGRVVAETLYVNGAETAYNEYTYNEKDLVVLKNTLDAQTNTLTKTAYTYDDEGILLSTLDSNVNGVPMVKREYNENGVVAFATSYAEDGSIALNVRFEYDEEGRTILEENYDAEGIFTGKTVYYYRPDGGVDHTVYDSSGLVVEDTRNPVDLPENEEDREESDDETTDTPNNSTPDNE